MGRLDTVKHFALAALIIIGALTRGVEARAQTQETLIVAGGCFWCVESDFESVKGVTEAVSGYIGGTTRNPTYKQVGGGGTGHYEAVKILFDPSVVSRESLLKLFIRSIDPTDAGGQFCDRGAPYRSAIFVSNKGEKDLAERIKSEAQAALGRAIVTPILDATTFYKAEDYHQDYYKGDNLVLTRFGPLRQSKAYKRYRTACGRDARVAELWGKDAPFVGTH